MKPLPLVFDKEVTEVASDYDNGKVTDREKAAAKRQNTLANYNASRLRKQLGRSMANYDFSDEQNKNLLDLQYKQNKQYSNADRWEAYRDLINAGQSVIGAMGPTALNSSSTGALLQMLQNRNDKDNSVYWNQLQENNNNAYNKYQESLNANNVARNEAAANAEKGLADIAADTAANLSNINPNLFKNPSKIFADSKNDPTKVYAANDAKANDPKMKNYVMPANAAYNVMNNRNRIQNGGYFGQLLNGFNSGR